MDEKEANFCTRLICSGFAALAVGVSLKYGTPDGFIAVGVAMLLTVYVLILFTNK